MVHRARALASVTWLTWLTCAASACSAGAGSGGAAPPAAPARSGEVLRVPPFVSRSWVVPDAPGDAISHGEENGAKLVLENGIRMRVGEGGKIERAKQRLPDLVVRTSALPSRLGGGYLFHATSRGSTLLWRSATWLGDLTPLAQLTVETTDVTPGFDRLYARLANSGRVVGLDAATGRLTSLGALPPTSFYGGLAFADGWRGVVEVDFRGPLATFDAGQTWKPLALAERVKLVGVFDGNPGLVVDGGRYELGPDGATSFRADPPSGSGSSSDDDAANKPKSPGPLGERPLRAAVEDGYPDSETTALVARAGALARVSLVDGTVTKLRAEAFAERHARCSPVRVGTGFGFVCGERDGPTAVYAFAPPFELVALLRFDKPRFVTGSGNGALVVRGACDDVTAPSAEGRPYCVRSASGAVREFRVRGEIGVERVVGLADGRIAVVVPPRGKLPGQLTLVRGNDVLTVKLALPEASANDPRAPTPYAALLARRGLWLEGFEEREPGVLSGWIDGGGPVVGVRVKLDGAVSLGEPRGAEGTALASGRFGFVAYTDSDAEESLDGGFTWKPARVPELPAPARPVPGATRGCGPVGCAAAGFLRVGWGEPRVADDLAVAPRPDMQPTPLRTSTRPVFECSAPERLPVPPSPKAKPKKPKPASPILSPSPSSTSSAYGYPRYRSHYAYEPPWAPFRGVDAPALDDDETGFDNGASWGAVQLRAYAWGKRGADWSRVGKWLVRFDDRFDAGAHVRSTLATTPPWPDENTAAEQLGVYGSGYYWSATADLAGHGVLAQSCRGTLCTAFALEADQPITMVRDANGKPGTLPAHPIGGAVKLGDGWLYLAAAPGNDGIALWRIELGVARHVATLARPRDVAYFGEERVPPARLLRGLARRASGVALGLVFMQSRGPEDRPGTLYVQPLSLEGATLGEPIELGPADLGGAALERCAAGQDGWLLESEFTQPLVRLPPEFTAADAPAMRLRRDPGVACVDALALSTSTYGAAEPAKPGAPPSRAAAPKPVPADAIPLALNEVVGARRTVLQCKAAAR